MSIIEKASGKLKQAVADLTDDDKLHREGRREQRKGEAKESATAPIGRRARRPPRLPTSNARPDQA
jgi:CsbD-like